MISEIFMWHVMICYKQASPWIACILDPVQKSLQTLCQMRGNTAIFEACCRAANCPQGCTLVLVVLAELTTSALLLSTTESSRSVPSYVSLAANMRKVLFTASKVPVEPDQQPLTPQIFRMQESFEHMKYFDLISACQSLIINLDASRMKHSSPLPANEASDSQHDLDTTARIWKSIVKHNIHWLHSILLYSLVHMCKLEITLITTRPSFLQERHQLMWV